VIKQLFFLFCVLETDLASASRVSSVEHNQLQDINMRVCNREIFKCLELISVRSDKSLLGDIYSLTKPVVVLFDSRTYAPIDHWEAQSGYWDLHLNRIVLQKKRDIVNSGLVEVVFDLDNLQQTTFVMK